MQSNKNMLLKLDNDSLRKDKALLLKLIEEKEREIKNLKNVIGSREKSAMFIPY